MQAVFGRLIPLSALFALLITALAAEARSIHERRGSATAIISFTADRTTITAGDSVLLSWASNTKRCEASGGWSGKQPAYGSYQTPPLTQPASFTLACTERGVTNSKTVAVAVNQPAPEPTPEPEPAPEPAPDPVPDATLQLSADAKELRPGESTMLRWSGEYVSSCRASGNWSGSKAATGTYDTGSLNADSTYTITCDSAQGTLVAVTSILVTSGGATITWQAPTENVDGSPLNDLDKYRIYVGTSAQAYDQQIEVTNPQTNSQFVPLERGDYRVAMTAVDADGNESAYSNEVIKTVY